MKKEKHSKRIAPPYKVIKGKRVPVCDYHGSCKNKACKEVYPFLLGEKPKNKGWSYLCKKHFKQEQTKYKDKLPFCAT